MRRIGMKAILVSLTVFLGAVGATASDLVPFSEASDQIRVIDLALTPTQATGRVVNRTSNVVRKVRLSVRLVWYWNDERNPGADSPGRSFFYSIPGEISPEGELRFAVQLDPPLPDRTDGRFAPFASVAGFEEIESTP